MNWYKLLKLAQVQNILDKLSLSEELRSFIVGSNQKVQRAALAVIVPLAKQNKSMPSVEELKSKLKILDRPKSQPQQKQSPFETQKAKYIAQGIQEAIVDDYLKWFDKIRKMKPGEVNNVALPHIKDKFDISQYNDFHDLEQIVDYVRGQTKVRGDAHFEDVQFDAKPVAKNGPIEVYYAGSKHACVHYKGDNPYSWCVARSDSNNMYNTYRYKENEPAFYFVKNTDRTKKEFEYQNTKPKNPGEAVAWQDPYHFFVIQVDKWANTKNEEQKQYYVTSANNDGDRQMSWSEIVAIEPGLAGMQKYFQPKPLTEKERADYNRFARGVSDQEFAKLTYEEKEKYLDIYVGGDRILTTNQFKDLPYDLKNKYIGFGVGLTDEQFELIKNDRPLMKRYKQITERKAEEELKGSPNLSFTDSECGIALDFYDKNEEAINNYIYSGRRLPFLAEAWAMEKLNSPNPNQGLIEAIDKYISVYGDAPYFAYQWTEKQMNSSNPNPGLIEAINKRVSVGGDIPYFANNWLANQMNSLNPNPGLIEAINKRFSDGGDIPYFAKEWYARQPKQASSKNWYKKSQSHNS